MNPKIYKQTLLSLAAFLAVDTACFAQTGTGPVTAQPQVVSDASACNDKAIQLKIDNLNVNIKIDLKYLEKNLVSVVNDIVPKIDLDLRGLSNSLDLDFSDNNLENNINLNGKTDKFKSYSKSYPLDANDKIRLSNQYGKITVNTWDRHEVKVDVQIKASADNDSEAQKLLDGVQVRDGKDGNTVSFRTSIEPNNGSSWKIWEWIGKKNHKLEINYTVYMPAKTDLNVEDSYGSIQLPELDGKVKISSSYGSVAAENLSNPSDEIEGSYGSLKVGSLNGGHLDYSYGSVDIDECNNLKADLSYGSFKLGKLKGAGDFDLSYVGGFKIEEVGSSFKRMNVNASYSGVSLGVPDNNNFNFDVTVTYGGFSYNDNKVTITSKTPPDGSKHVSMTKNYKGFFGKTSNDVQVNIHSTYGSVNFE